MRRFRTIATVDGDSITLETDWTGMEAAHRAAALAGLQEHLGCRHGHEPMELATKPMGEVPDPRYGELLALIEHARADWDAWGPRLTRRVLDLLDAGKLLPMTEASEKVIRALFDDHRLAMVIDMAGPGRAGRDRVMKLVEAGLVSPEIASQGGYVEVAYRLGKGLETLKQHERPITTREFELGEVIEEALKPQLTVADRHAIRWAQERAGELIRRPADKAASAVTRRLSDEELGSLRTTVSKHLADGDRGNLKHDLQEAIKGTDLTNDLDRIVRTEIAFAHNYGAYQKLKEETKALGEADPQVYRVASVNACKHCLRIWGPPSAPVVYRLSEIEQWEADGGNVGVPAAEWGPVIGPVHPNCACSPLAYYRADLEDAIRRATDLVISTFGKF